MRNWNMDLIMNVCTPPATLCQSSLTVSKVLKSCGNYMYHQVHLATILRSAHTVYLCVLCGPENKQRLFPYTTLIDWFV